MTPRDINAGIYFLGNGIITLLISGGFYIMKKINTDYRALNTANEFVEILISAGVTAQIIKGLQEDKAQLKR